MTEVDTCHHKIKEATDELMGAADRYEKRLSDGQINEFFRQYRDNQVAVFFIDQLRKLRDQKESEAIESESELARIQESIQPLRCAIDALEDFVQEFRRRYNL